MENMLVVDFLRSFRGFHAAPMKTRLLFFGAVVLLLALWLFPLVATTYSVWNDVDHLWVPFETIYEREFVTNVEFGDVPYHPWYRDSLLNMAYSRTGEAGQPITRGIGIKWSTQIVQTLLLVGMAWGLLWVMRAAAELTARGELKTQVPLSKSKVRRLAEQGDPLAQCWMASLLSTEWFRATGVSTRHDVKFTGEVILREGPGDDEEAARWYRRAADQGDAGGQWNLGMAYEEGRGITQDFAEAVRWYRKAADQDHAAAQWYLGDKYANGEGVNKDLGEAIRWYRKSTDQGNTTARSRLVKALFELGTSSAQR